ncbi:hypothetical protein B0H66DRAFT_537744 [Apodospora peruviana]|uniref:Uncharacterized protein n=1 Tax=Apodospora peruviana TaxID=516989 RepID=A0AAE0HTK0_9PEZI|nr:hypothetical protein B0H66DRAFT_537744 [Apodospora peruviana]
MTTQLDDNEVGSPRSPEIRDGSNDVLSYLPTELITAILGHLHYTGSVTSYRYIAGRPEIRQEYIEARSDFSSLCRVSKFLYPIASRRLYHTIVLQSEKELFLFFRTIANDVNLRLAVRSFAWDGHLSVDDNELASLALTCWGSGTCWRPSSPEDIHIAQLMGISDDTLHSWRVLGAVLAMISEVKSLFVLLDFEEAAQPQVQVPGSNPRCLEQDALRQLIPIVGGENRVVDRQFLQKLEVVAFEPHVSVDRVMVMEGTCTLILKNSPLLRRIELKGGMWFKGVVALREYEGSNVVWENVKELIQFGATALDIASIVTVFPHLSVLEIELQNGAAPSIFEDDPPTSQALLRVSRTLETLSLMTALGKNSWVRVEPALLPALKRMKALKHLTTESIWLCGREGNFDSSSPADFQLSDLLPPTLESFHLIDHWGMDMSKTFYPSQFPNDWTPLQFYGHFFWKIYDECATRTPSLRHIAFAPHPYLFSDLTTNDQPRTALELLNRFRDLFARIGVRFSLTTRRAAATQRHLSWANMGNV